MNLSQEKNHVTLGMSRDEALVLFEMLQRWVENEAPLLRLFESSAEFAVLCRINSHLEQGLKEPLLENYESLLAHARAAIIKESGHYIGIEER